MPEFPLKRIPRPEGGTEYDEWQDHPLNGCPQYILDAARKSLNENLREPYGGLLWYEIESLADAIVADLREKGYING